MIFKVVALSMSGLPSEEMYLTAREARANYIKHKATALFASLFKGDVVEPEGKARRVRWGLMFKYTRPKTATGSL